MGLQRFLFGSLNAKLLTILMLVALFTSVTASTIFTIYELNTVTKSERSRLNSIANILAPNLTAAVLFEDENTLNELIKPLLNQTNIVSARVVNSDGTPIVTLATEIQSKTLIFHQIMVISTALSIDEVEYGQLEIKADYSLIEKRLIFFSLFLIGFLTFILMLSFLLALFLRKNLIKPLIDLTSVADLVTKTNNYSIRSNVLSTDEVGNLANCFNLMLERIEERDNSLEVQVEQRTKALELANAQLRIQANTDHLTGLPNRRFILNKLSALIHNSSDINFAVLGLDLDGFKEINDTMGHDYGDLLLTAVSRRLLKALPKEVTVARIGGDEFIILIENTENRQYIENIARKIKVMLTDSFVIKGKHIYLTTSIGIAVFPDDGGTVETVVKYADLAMYKSKENGRNCYHFFEHEMLDHLVKKRELVDDLRRGIETGEFELYYQPIINLQTNQVRKAEALIRWNHPARGIVSPVEFISVAEEIGLIKKLGEWVAQTASSDLASFLEMGAEDFQISINVSPLQLKSDENWMLNWLEYMAHLGLKRNAIIVEITESLLMENEESIRSKLTQLKDHGISIAIDDFGVGYSSLSYLQKMDVDILKIDKSFVDGITTESNSQDLCRTMIMMARHLDIQVIAEGIEEEKQKEILTDFGCEFGQGYLFSKPLPLSAFKQKYSSLIT